MVRHCHHMIYDKLVQQNYRTVILKLLVREIQENTNLKRRTHLFCVRNQAVDIFN
jgi:hypothetical protein